MSTETAVDPREDKLPKWAREELHELRRRTREAEKLAEDARLATDPDSVDTLLMRGIREPIGLGTGPTVRFRLGDGRGEFIDVRYDSRAELVYMHGDSGIAVLPRATNAIAVRSVGR